MRIYEKDTLKDYSKCPTKDENRSNRSSKADYWISQQYKKEFLKTERYVIDEVESKRTKLVIQEQLRKLRKIARNEVES